MIVASTSRSYMAGLAASFQSRPGRSADGTRRRIRHCLGPITHRALSRRIGIDSKPPEVMVGPIDIRSNRVNKLDVYAQRHRDIVAVLQPVRAVDRNVNAISGSQPLRQRPVLQLGTLLCSVMFARPEPP